MNYLISYELFSLLTSAINPLGSMVIFLMVVFDFGISKKGMCVINSIAFDVFEQVALEASKLVRYQKKKTLTGQDIQSAVKLLLPVDLGNHAVVEGEKAVSKFNGNKK